MPLITKAAQRQENKNAFYNFSEKTFRYRKNVGTSDSGNDTESIYVYEKGNDCESLFILRESWINAEIK
ncbi:TPA: cobalamin biosynthesis protein CbiX, partial [Escherichia coli]